MANTEEVTTEDLELHYTDVSIPISKFKLYLQDQIGKCKTSAVQERKVSGKIYAEILDMFVEEFKDFS